MLAAGTALPAAVLGRDRGLTGGALMDLDILDDGFLPSQDLKDRLSEDHVQPFMARCATDLSPRESGLVPHMALPRGLRLVASGGVSTPGMDITYGNFARLFPDRIQIETIAAGQDAVATAADIHVAFRDMTTPAPDSAARARQAGMARIYAMDDNLLRLREIPFFLEQGYLPEVANVRARLEAADQVIAWSPVSAAEFRTINPRVHVLATNIAAGRLTDRPTPPAHDGRVVYTTLTQNAFQKLPWWQPVLSEWADFFRRHADRAQLVLFGAKPEDDEMYRAMFEGIDYRFQPSRGYGDFIRESTEAGFHFAINQMLDDCDFTRSKCPIKFLDATAVGAVLLTADTRAFQDVAPDAVIKVPPRPGAWRDALERSLAMSAAEREGLWATARRQVLRDYTTEVQYLRFCQAHHAARLHLALDSGSAPGGKAPVTLGGERNPVTSALFDDLAALNLAPRFAGRPGGDPGDARLVIAWGTRSPWIAAARAWGLPCIALADFADVAASPESIQPDGLWACSPGTAWRARAGGWANVAGLRPAFDPATTGAPGDGRRLAVVSGEAAPTPQWRRTVADLAGRLGFQPVDDDAEADIVLVCGCGAQVYRAALAAMLAEKHLVCAGPGEVDALIRHGGNGWATVDGLAAVLSDIAAMDSAGARRLRAAARQTALTWTDPDARRLDLTIRLEAVARSRIAASAEPAFSPIPETSP